MTTPTVSVVIPTKDRPILLSRCLGAVLAQECESSVEVVVVNDGGAPVDQAVAGDHRVTLIEGPSRGPAGARNAGIARASGDIVLFTDDDAIPQPGWVHAAVAALARVPEAVGVIGRVESPRFDPLYEHSVRNEGSVGNFLTCNAAYRRSALEQLGGFDEAFPHPAAEDRDLGYRMQRLGPVLYDGRMAVVHPPRPVRIRDVVRRGRFVESDLRLHLKHPQTRPPRWSANWGPLIRLMRQWYRLRVEENVIDGSPRRGLRYAAMAAGQTVTALLTSIRLAARRQLLPSSEVANSSDALRIAWIGPAPEPGGGVAGCAWELVHGLAGRGCEIDCFFVGPHETIPKGLWSVPGVRVVNFDTGWRFDRWYSTSSIAKVLTGSIALAWGRRRLGALVVAQHRLRPYDVIYQFSAIELFGLRRHLGELPPLVLHPETHAAGELRGLRSERHLAARCQPLWRRAAMQQLQRMRARRQRRDLRRAHTVLGISRAFVRHLVTDYDLDPAKVALVPNPVALDDFSPSPHAEVTPRRVVFVGRISVRKGIEQLIELSHRLADLEGQLVLDIVGAETLWSDYRPLLTDLHPGVARYRGYLRREELQHFLTGADVLVQPATFEPFGLNVAEALASGVPVVATDEVGAVEDVSSDCSIVVRANDARALEEGVREMLRRLEDDGDGIRKRARSEAESLFDPERVVQLAMDALAATADRRRDESPDRRRAMRLSRA